ncbi:hypothetical protein RJ40_00325 [Methanofollis aquaemaris]|uniref:NAD(P)/FAD-dependent oxidoreductase n=1 Tax=Methanofollis aquaemaris TaxID=126734 RepID=A0A8A3S0T5_9EURY|nr:hypothetical protein [Methanofollis aquaemaris]QSZ66055.1 hypothetical protein RJ40_00325 [Methanofollis aquaemaris]
MAVAGAGVAGSYLAFRLLDAGYAVDLYDLPAQTACGTAPCAWMATRDFSAVLEAEGFEPEKYVTARFDVFLLQGQRVGADLMTIDKPALVADLRGGAEVRTGPLDPAGYDRVIDATGTARACLPPIAADDLCRCVQFRVRDGSGEALPAVRYVRGGYAWSFPLGGGERHVGCLSHLADPVGLVGKTGFLDGERLCGCRGRLRVTSPYGALPFVSGNVWGVGEAIGCVYPLVGDGIVPALVSARLLLDHFDDPAGYTQAVLDAFPAMQQERTVLERMKDGRRPSPAWLAEVDTSRLGIRVGVASAAGLLLKMLAR